MARVLGESRQSFSATETGRKPLGMSILKKFSDFGINPEYILLGSGSMFASTEAGRSLAAEYGEETKSEIVKENHYNDDNYIPVYDVDAQAGTSLFPDSPDESLIDYIKIPGVKADGAIVVHGDSMQPEYQPGDLILVKKMTGNVLQFGKAFLVCTSDQRMIKYIFPANGDERTIILRSCNDRYPDFNVEKKDILHLYLIIGKFRKEVV